MTFSASLPRFAEAPVKHARRSPLTVSSLLALAVACGEQGPPPAAEQRPIVGVMEVPISLRNDGPPPSDAIQLQASPSELHVNGQRVLTLERGRIPAAEIGPEGVTKLRAAIAAAPARSRAQLVLHAMVGYGTLARSVQALTEAGYREVSIAVRPLTSGAPPASMSWLALSAPRIAPAGAAPVDPAQFGGTSRNWSDFTAHWQETYDACRAARYIDCDPVPLATPEDGLLQVTLWARGQGMQIRFQRIGPPVPDPAQPRGPALIEGVRREPAGAGEEVPPTPDTDAVFTFRAEVATSADSGISQSMRPACGAAPCFTVLEADEETPVMRVVSFLGAAFPNGSAMPQLVLRLPD